MISLFRVLAQLPLPLMHALGAVLGWVSFLASPTLRRRFLANAHQAGFGMDTVRPAVAEAGKLVAEVPRLWFGRQPRIEWEGTPLVEAALARGRGLIFLTPHLGCFEAAARSYAAQFGPITALYRPARKAWLRELVDTSRARRNLAAAPTTLAGVRQLLKALRAGEAVGLLPDQVPPQGMGVWAPFFGRPAYTMTLSARLARQTGAAVLLAWCERRPWGAGYCVHVRPWEGDLAQEPVAAAAQINARMEQLVRECPRQYLWGYARYKAPAADRVA